LANVGTQRSRVVLSIAPSEAFGQGNGTQDTGVASKRDALAMQEELSRREQQLKSLEKEIDGKLAKLTEMESRLKRMLAEAKEVKDKKLRHLIDVYSNMKAQQAATVLETLDEDIAVKILAGMRGRQAGEILNFVKSDKAARLSEMLTRLQTQY